MQKITLSLAAAVLAVAGTSANAAVSYTSQARSIRTQGGTTGPGSFTISAPGFGPFVESRTDFFPNVDGSPDSRGAASQNSTLGADFIRLSGAVSGTDSYGSGGAGSGYGTSMFNVAFTLAQDTPYSFFGTHSTSFNFFGGISDWLIRLSRADGTVFFERTDTLLLQGAPDQDPGPFSRNGVLSAGSYRLQADFSEGWVGNGTGSGSGAFDLTLNLPAPGTGCAVMTCLAMGLRRRRRSGC